MSPYFHIDRLPKPQRELWPRLRETPSRFVLYGGTAVALHLGHRESEDFDFFSTEPFVPRELKKAIPYLRDSHVTQQEENTLSCHVGRDVPVKVSFFGNVGVRAVNQPEIADNGLGIASLLDVAATKAGVVQGRASRKDYLDMAAIIDAGVPLEAILGAAGAVFGTAEFNPLITLKALAHTADTRLRDLSGQGLSQKVQDTLSRAVHNVQLSNIHVPETQPTLYGAPRIEPNIR